MSKMQTPGMARGPFCLSACSRVTLMLLLCLLPPPTTGVTLSREDAQRTRHKHNYYSRRPLKQLALPLIPAQHGASPAGGSSAVAKATAASNRHHSNPAHQATTLRSITHSSTGITPHSRAALLSTAANCLPVAFLQKTHIVTASWRAPSGPRSRWSGAGGTTACC